jgi:hypothetical protein
MIASCPDDRELQLEDMSTTRSTARSGGVRSLKRLTTTLHRLSVRRAQRPACQPRHLGRAVALVELVAPSQPERSGDTRRLASPPRPELAGLCHSSRDGGGIEGIAAERPGWHSLRRNGLAAGHGEASGIGIHVTSPWPPKTRPSRPVNGRTTRQIDTKETRPRFRPDRHKRDPTPFPTRRPRFRPDPVSDPRPRFRPPK